MNDYTNFNPRTYLQEYYSTIPEESRALLAFLVHAFSTVPTDSFVLDLGSGPTLYSPIAAARRVTRMVCSDFTPANLDEISSWLTGDPEAFSWRAHIETVLDYEYGIGNIPITEAMIAEREAQIRACVVDVIHCDVRRMPVLDGEYQKFDVLVSNLCLEAAARTLDEWHECVARASDLLTPGGRLIMSAVQNCDTYRVGDHKFPVVPVGQSDFQEALNRCGYIPESIEFAWTPATHDEHPYDGMLFVTAQKKRQEV